MVIDEARGAEVNDLDFTSAVRLDEDVLWLQVAVNEPQGVHVVQGSQDLSRDLLQPSDGKVRLISAFPIELAELVQVVTEKLGHDDQVLLVVEVIVEAQDVVVVDIAVYIDVLQQLDLIQGLVEEVLVILDNFHADHLVRVQVQALDCT